MAIGTYLNSSNFNGKGGEHFELRLTYSLGEYNQVSNTRNITKYLYFIAKDNYSAGGSKFTGYIDDVAVGSGNSIGKNQELLVGQKTDSIEYNNDGTKSISYSALIDTPWTLGDASVSGTLQLPQVNRLSTFNFTNYQMTSIEDTLPILINKYVNSYTNKLIVLSNDRNTIYRTVDNVLNGYELTFTEEELNKIYTSASNTNNAYFVLRLETYDGNTKIGQVEIGYFGYIINANPTFTSVIEETDTKVIEVLGNSSANSIVKDLSKPKITITPTLKKGATLKNIQIQCNDGQTIAKSTTPYEFLFNNVAGAKFNITVTDSRSNFATSSIEKTLVNYIPINISSYSFKRQNSTSSNIILNASASVYSGLIDGKNNTITVQYKLNSGEWVTIDPTNYTVENNILTITNYTITDILSYQTTGTFSLYIKDLLSEDQENYKVSQGVDTMDMGKSDVKVNGDLFVADTLGENKKNVMGEIYKRAEVLIAGINDQQNLPADYIVNLDKEIQNTSTSLTLEAGKIKIGSGVSVVEVSGNLMISNVEGSWGYIWGRITKYKQTNSSVEQVESLSSSISAIGNVTSTHLSTPCPSVVVNVKDGDLIGFATEVSGFSSTPYLRPLPDATWLQVRVLK